MTQNSFNVILIWFSNTCFKNYLSIYSKNFLCSVTFGFYLSAISIIVNESMFVNGRALFFVYE